jgi:hypothetical protein
MSHSNDPTHKDPKDCLGIECRIKMLLVHLSLVIAEALPPSKFWLLTMMRSSTHHSEKNYSLSFTEVFGKVNCFVASKILGF